jgi:hypothetical protein
MLVTRRTWRNETGQYFGECCDPTIPEKEKQCGPY